MKHFYVYFLLFSMYLSFGQVNPNQYDYFVQFNGNQLSKKVSVADVLNHPLISQYKQGKANLDLDEYIALFKWDQKATFHGSFTDSLPYYQVTIPIIGRQAFKKFIIEKEKKKLNTDLVEVSAIQDFAQYSVYTPKGEKASFAWNENYLVIFEYTKKFKTFPLTSQGYVSVTEPYQEYDEKISEQNGVINQENDEQSDVIIEEAPPRYNTSPVIDIDEYEGSHEEYKKEQADFDYRLAEKQRLYIKALFENGFTVPSSNKINATADISSWVNYSSVMSSLGSAYNAFSQFSAYNKFLPVEKNIGDMIRGIGLDLYFDNDNAKVEEVIEYSPEMAVAIQKITDRKINKNLFNYFPADKPLGYMSYHLNTKAALETFPSLTASLFQNPKLVKEDILLITDLISTIVDEQATSTLLDGDLAMFVYGTKEVEVLTKAYEYGDNYEEIETEKKIKKTIPLFSAAFTSTHPTFGDKLIQLGVRKGILIQQGEYYMIARTEEYGTIFIKKDKDVVVVTNTFDYFNGGKGSFVSETKKALKKNYMSAKLNLAELATIYKNEGKMTGVKSEKMERVANQFNDVTIESPKKLIDNKLIFGFKLSSSKSDKNIILQTLDLVQEVSK
ncbi:hypothetical protein [Flavobacterium hercynium]|uniref:DUF4836 domain-containing protein n=1 Tax=Flavobacterium hercynium TaxID=387094 RepID=A0A226HK85_9FLAO|nr:hypothetical protein [Flavobacterium hercynium]OXA94749.1 hypothetical protein B0A66_03200 [Flavobacterium hercynium]SMP07701.1 hypothetical protein SAMN06265346_10270 [Flavobacterium hercynium]